jgi:hypothetical protein
MDADCAVSEDYLLPVITKDYLRIRTEPGTRGRGVYACFALTARTLIDVSPILFFPDEQYGAHGRFTELDNYTFKWPGGMALALGTGSLFNHAGSRANVGWQRDVLQRCIRFTTLRGIEAGEELCIDYGRHVWFEVQPSGDGAARAHHDPSASDCSSSSDSHSEPDDTGWLAGMGIPNDDTDNR